MPGFVAPFHDSFDVCPGQVRAHVAQQPPVWGQLGPHTGAQCHGIPRHHLPGADASD